MIMIATVGVNAGYFHRNENVIDFEKIQELWDSITAYAPDMVMPVYLPATFQPTIVFYKKEWGCPDGGETCLRVESMHNPVFMSEDAFVEVSTRYIEALSIALDQQTAQIHFHEGEFVYLTKKNEQ